jgi:hypothetical protein
MDVKRRVVRSNNEILKMEPVIANGIRVGCCIRGAVKRWELGFKRRVWSFLDSGDSADVTINYQERMDSLHYGPELARKLC